MTSTPARRIWSPPMPKIAAPVRSSSAAARPAAYISPLASPAERRICGAGIVGRWCSVVRGQRRWEGWYGRRARGRHVQFLLFVLQLVQSVVDTAQHQKLLMSALFAQAAFMEDQDAVGMLNRAEAMGDDQRRAAGKQLIQGLAYEQFGLGVHAGGGFVKDQKARIVRQRSRKVDELALPDRQRGAAFVHRSSGSVRKVIHKVAQPDFLDGALDVFA